MQSEAQWIKCQSERMSFELSLKNCDFTSVSVQSGCEWSFFVEQKKQASGKWREESARESVKSSSWAAPSVTAGPTALFRGEISCVHSKCRWQGFLFPFENTSCLQSFTGCQTKCHRKSLVYFLLQGDTGPAGGVGPKGPQVSLSRPRTLSVFSRNV